MFIKIFTAGPLQTHAILLGCTKTFFACIIDAPQQCTHAILKTLEEQGLTAKALLLTHSHWDHIADVSPLTKSLKIPVYVHIDDAPNVINPGIDGLEFPFTIQGNKIDHFLEEAKTITIGNLEIHPIHTPGHSPGSTCFWLPQENLLISGDTLFQGTMGTLNLPTARPERMKNSLEKLSKLPKNTRVIPGHGNETTIGQESWIQHFSYNK